MGKQDKRKSAIGRLLKWLGRGKIQPTNEDVLGTMQAMQANIRKEMSDTRAALALTEGRCQTSVREIIDVSDRFDGLCDLMGVVITVDQDSSHIRATASSTRPDGLLGDAREYIDSVVAAEKILNTNYRLMKQNLELLDKIKPAER